MKAAKRKEIFNKNVRVKADHCVYVYGPCHTVIHNGKMVAAFKNQADADNYAIELNKRDKK